MLVILESLLMKIQYMFFIQAAEARKSRRPGDKPGTFTHPQGDQGDHKQDPGRR